MSLSWARGLAALGGAALLLGCGGQGVVRVYEAGKPTTGRFISEYAYALYAQGAEAEDRGDFAAAARAFEAAASEDGPNAEVWTRVGATRCASGDGAARAEDAFARARAADPSYEPMHRERARCLLRLGRAAEALEEARASLALDPDREDTSFVLAEAAERAGHREDALRVLHALTVARPRSIRAATALRAASVRFGMTAFVEKVDAGLAANDGRDESALESERPGLAGVDAALVRGDGAEASRLAKRAHLGASELSVRAAALGRARVAREQAELILGADPANASARIAAAVAGDALGETETIERALASLPARGVTPPSALARLLLAELIDRRAGREAARAYLGPELIGSPAVDDKTDPRSRSVDPLYARTAERVRARLREAGAEQRAEVAR